MKVKDELFDKVESIMKAQQGMYKAGYDEGYHKGVIDGINKAKEIVDNTFDKKEE